jgi:hypothetical protein
MPVLPHAEISLGQVEDVLIQFQLATAGTDHAGAFDGVEHGHAACFGCHKPCAAFGLGQGRLEHWLHLQIMTFSWFFDAFTTINNAAP